MLILKRDIFYALAVSLLALGPAAVQAEVAPVASPFITPQSPAQPQSNSITDALVEAAGKLNPQATDIEKSESDALVAFYQKRGSPLWIANAAITDGARALARELSSAMAYGLDPKAFIVPDLASGVPSDPKLLAEFDVTINRAALAYARHARGGRIASPAQMLNSNLDRKPQLIAPAIVLDTLAQSTEPDAALRGFHPKHPQFERLRQAYLKALPAEGAAKPLNAAAKKLRANMEMWRWMWDDLGPLHVFNNIPEFMQYVYMDGQVIRSEKIVVGMLDKQSSVFSRPLKYVVLRPKWRVPESIMVREVWPSLLRGGGLMRQYGLEVETKNGEPRNWRTIDWAKDDIRNYNVTQAPGPNSSLGYVKFSFPSQHTIFMHDTPDKWMFKSTRRTLSHGCLRVQKPMQLAEIILREDKGWDAAKVAMMSRAGPLNNEIAIDKNIPIHLAYFTAWVDDDGRLKAFSDIYGHEKRVTQALDGAWAKINKGRDHLAPVQPNFNPATVAQSKPAASAGRKDASVSEMINNAMGISF